MVELNAVPMEDRTIVRNVEPTEHHLLLEPSPRWVRVIVNGVAIADSRNVVLADESKHMPVYYFPVEDVRMDLLTPSGRTRDLPELGTATYLSVNVDGKQVDNAGWVFDGETSEKAAGLRGMVAFYWSKMDQWLEEDDEVYVHPRDPRHRVDVCNSSRHVQVTVLGKVVADSTRPRILFETNLPIRFYIPRADLAPGVLVDSDTTSQCPYKGVASYHSIRVGDTIAKDVAWYYRYPLAEAAKIENLVCFFNERVDAIVVDGEELPKPRTPWTKAPQLIKVTD